MPTKINRGQRLPIPFKDGVSIYDSQNKPRMYLTQKAFEKSFPKYLIDDKGVELVEFAEVRHESWVAIPVNGEFKFRCSNIDCARLIPPGYTPKTAKWCPNCGSIMDGEVF